MSEPQVVTKNLDAIETVEELLAHALVMEDEMVDRYVEIADAMEVHNNLEVAELFRKLSEYGRKHVAEIKQKSEGLDLPHIAPWDFKWGETESPETAAVTNTHYLMKSWHALQLAHKAECGARDFYASIRDATGNEDVRRIAAEFAEEEGEHVELLEEMIAKQPEPEEDWDFDPDPPVLPD